MRKNSQKHVANYTKVATVGPDGEVTGVKAGSATITVTTKDGGKRASCSVSVTNVALEGIALDKDKSTLKIGDVLTLSVTYTPGNATEKGVSWTSGKSEVASVDQSGKVTAVSEGVSQIVATSKDGGFKAVCNVTVEGISVTGIMHVDGIYYQPVSVGSTDVEVTNKKGGYIGENENDYGGSVKVPSTFDYKGVTYRVKKVGNFAFYGCHSLTSVTLPEGLTDIESRAFVNCGNLETLSIPSSLTFVNESNSVFVGCKKLNISVASGGAFKTADGMLSGNYSSYNRLVWLQESRTGEVSVPEGITCINSDATTSSPMTKITIPATVTYIGGRNFERCANLKEVVLCWSEAQLGELIYDKNVATAYFVGAVYTDITVRVPKGTKAAYEAHKLWGMGFNIAEYEVPVSSVTLDKTTLSLQEGGSGALKATVNPETASDKTVTWTSSNESVATVDASGNVKAVKAGSATITVTTKDGSKKATCSVTVTAPAGEVVFEDANFKAALISSGVDTNGDGMISESEAEAVTTINVNPYISSITSLGGIEKFINLEILRCYGEYNKLGGLKSLDLSKNTKLETVSCSYNQLTTLDVSKNTALISLICGSNQLTSLDVSKNTVLRSLNCGSNQLTSLDVSKNTVLTYLTCDDNQLTTLDISKNTALIDLYCRYNQLTVLDVSKNLALTELNCAYMSTLLTLYMASGQVIDYINGTGDKARSSSYIPETATITVK